MSKSSVGVRLPVILKGIMDGLAPKSDFPAPVNPLVFAAGVLVAASHRIVSDTKCNLRCLNPGNRSGTRRTPPCRHNGYTSIPVRVCPWLDTGMPP